MDLSSQPLVSIVTPVYNGERYLAECIESVVAQTYEHWEYLILNNCSTDRTLEIAEHYARMDSRIRIHTNAEHLPQFQNWNHALREISPKSKYCKEVHADDWLFLECITAMVRLAEANPSVGIVGSYRLAGHWIKSDGLPHPSTVVPGREACRSFLLGGPYVFGSPTSNLRRADLIRHRPAVYDDSHLIADIGSCLDALQHSDFGFVHQVLTYTRVHKDSVTSTVADRLGTIYLGLFHLLIQYGPKYLTREEYANCLRNNIRRYNTFLVYNAFRRRGREFWKYHKKGREKLGYPISFAELVGVLLHSFIDHSLNPRRVMQSIECLAREIMASMTSGRPSRKEH